MKLSARNQLKGKIVKVDEGLITAYGISLLSEYRSITHTVNQLIAPINAEINF